MRRGGLNEMKTNRRKSGFTLIELLVVISIISLLIGILMPALARVRQLAYRMACGTHLSGIGRAMFVYANDYGDRLPKAGGRHSAWSNALPQWDAQNRGDAYKCNGCSGHDSHATISSHFYLLVKYAEVAPKQLLCKGDRDVREFKLSEMSIPVRPGFELADAWDFGTFVSISENPCYYYSYSYHAPFGNSSLTVSHAPAMAVAADRNPWVVYKRIEEDGKSFDDFIPDQGMTRKKGTSETAKVGNSDSHKGDGQNVLFLDNHVAFEKRSYCGPDNDNIYTYQSTGAAAITDLRGQMPPIYTYTERMLKSSRDSLLLQDTSRKGSLEAMGR